MLSTSVDAYSSSVTRLSWQGRDVEVVRDEWLIRMPQLNASLARNVADYQSVTPPVPAGWSVRDVGLGMYGIRAPGATFTTVSQWSSGRGTMWLQPNFYYRRQTVTPNDGPPAPPANPGFNSLWGLNNTGQIGVLNTERTSTLTGPGTIDADIDAPEAWSITTGSNQVIIAVLDDGIDYTHPDLGANVWIRPANVPATEYGLHGWDSADRDNDIRPTNPANAHGTHVAGTIGANGNNGLGVTGVAWNVQLYGAKVFSDNSDGASTSDQVDAITRIVRLKEQYNQNIVAINASLGGYGRPDSGMQAVITAAGSAGILFVAAAGNGGGEPSNPTDPYHDSIGDNTDDPRFDHYPSNYDVSNVISVAASNRQDRLTNFSNYGLNTVDIAAPGSGIWSTVPGGLYYEQPGTSMAAPHVTGVAALAASAYLAERNRLPTVAELRSAILDGADHPPTLLYTESAANGDPFPGVVHQISQNRRLNALGAIQRILGYPEISIDDVSLVEGNTGTTYADVVVTLSESSARIVTVPYATIDGSARTAGADYVATSGTLTFLPGETQKTIRITINGDTTIEPDETFTVQLSDAMNAVLERSAGTVMIRNDDFPPSVFANDIQVVEGTGGTSTATFLVQLTVPVAYGVTVRYVTIDRSASKRDADYRTAAGTAFIPAGQTSVAVPITVFGDAKYEADETFAVRLISATGVPISREYATCTILNDDPAPLPVVSISDVTLPEGNYAQKMFSFVVSLSERSPVTISVDFRTLDSSAVAGLDYLGRTGTLTFWPGVISRSITVWATGDNVVEPNERFLLQLSAPSNAILGRSAGIGTIVNDDKPTASRAVREAMFAAFAAEQSLLKPIAGRRR